MRSATGYTITAEMPPPRGSVRCKLFGLVTVSFWLKAACMVGALCMAFSASAKVTTEWLTGIVAGKYNEYLIDVSYQYDGTREKLAIGEIRSSVCVYKDNDVVEVYVEAGSASAIHYSVRPANDWYWDRQRTDRVMRSGFSGANVNRHALFKGAEYKTDLTVRFFLIDHVWIELDANVCASDGTYYFGVSRTDADREATLTKTATLRDYLHEDPCSWTGGSDDRFRYVGRQDVRETEIGAKLIEEENALVPAYSSSWKGETLQGSVAGRTASTNFTIVAVNVKLGDTDESDEESVGAMMGTNTPVKVTFEVHPGNLPSCLDEFGVTCDDLYVKSGEAAYNASGSEDRKKFCIVKSGTGIEYYRKFDTSTRCSARQLNNLYVICRTASGTYKDREIRIEHPASGARDLAKYTSVTVDIEITDYPTGTLLGEDKEEMPGAFIPYVADWGYGETPSGDSDIPFGSAAREKLVEVFVSYQPSDLPEDEDGGKILEFEAPQDSLYLPFESGGVDQRWREFVDWWNTRPASWLLAFEGKKRLLLHGHEKSNSQRDRVIRVTHPKSGATDVAKYTVYHVDLDIDSDNDLEMEREDGFEDAVEEREPGKIISYDQSGIRPGQDYRVPLKLKAWGGETNAVVKLEAVSSSQRVAEVYDSETGGTRVDLPAYFPAASIPSLYVDGVTNGTVSFTATLINPPKEVPANTTVRPVPGSELEKDKVAALIIQPISFSPGRGRHAGAWISDPCMSQCGNPNFAMRTANRIANVANSVGFTYVDHEEWCVDTTDGYDADPGDLTLERFKQMANCGFVLFKGHGGVGINMPVLFEDTPQGISAANAWCAGEVGLAAVPCRLNYANMYGVRCDSSWYAANWKQGLDQGDALVFWQSCHSADGSRGLSSVAASAGGRCCFAWNGEVSDSEAASEVRGTLEVMANNLEARSAILALEAGSAFLYGNCKLVGNYWTTLCPGPIPRAGYFPKNVVQKNTPTLGCLIFDTFIDDYWNPDDMIATSCGESIDGEITPCWLRQEGCNRPFGIRFKILKESDHPVEVTASHRKIRNSGTGDVLVRTGVDEVDEAMWDSQASGRSLDADGAAPNNSDLIWRY